MKKYRSFFKISIFFLTRLYKTNAPVIKIDGMETKNAKNDAAPRRKIFVLFNFSISSLKYNINIKRHIKTSDEYCLNSIV